MRQDLINRKIQKLLEYLDSFYVPDIWSKEIKERLENPERHFAYLCYPDFFWEAFDKTQLNDDKIDKISVAGYLYFSSIMYQDKLLDRHNSDLYKILPYISFLQEGTIKILLSIFSQDHELWKIWSTYRERYIMSINIDKEKNDQLSFEEYGELAINKSIYAQFAIDCCYFLSNQTKEDFQNYQNIIKSHEFFSFGFQILDDINDISEDFENKQKNIIIQNCLKIAKSSGKTIEGVNDLKRIFYTSGYSQELLTDCIKLFENSYNEVKSIDGLDLWKKRVLDSQKSAIFYLTQINTYLKEIC